jgi:NADH-quinone oxidoreductase subunit M
LNSFVGEFMTLLGAWQYSPWLAVVACIGLILAPVYMLRLFQGVFYAAPGEQLPDVSVSAGAAVGVAAGRIDILADELLVIAPLILLMVLLGLYPYLITHNMGALAMPLGWR